MRTHARLVAVLTVTVMLGALITVVAQEPAPWLHVQIESGNDGGNVGVNLPLGAVIGVLSMVPNSVVHNGQLEVGPEHGVSVSAVRDVWHELRSVGDAEFVTVQHGDATIRIALVGDRVEVRVEEPTETVRADVPAVVLDALLSGQDETLNIDAALDTLDTLRGEVVHVAETDRQIRVWIDEIATQ